jgi:HSP20 family protein
MEHTKAKTENIAVCEQKTDLRTYQPVVDIYRTDAAIYLNAEMPGVDETTLSVALDNDILALRGDTDTGLYHTTGRRHQEFRPGRYQRSFRLGQRMNRDGIQASFKNGLLQLEIPLRTERPRRKIKIESTS